jgi:hypothetical protein
MIIDNFSSNLHTLLLEIEEKIKTEIENENVIEIRELKTVTVIKNFNYHFDSHFLEFNSTFENEESIHKALKSKSAFFSDIEKSQLYKIIIDEMVFRYQIEVDLAHKYLLKLLKIIVNKILNGIKPNYIDFITLFVIDLEGGTIRVKIKLYLSGIWLDDEEYELDRAVKIRRITVSDILSASGDRPIIDKFDHDVGAILEIKAKVKDDENFHIQLFNEIRFYKYMFGLYKTGSVDTITYELFPESIIAEIDVFHWNRETVAPFIYNVGCNDIENIKIILPKWRNCIFPIIIDKRSPIGDSITRYFDATNSIGVIEYRIAYLVMSLEAMFLKGAERSELSHRLSQRIAILLQIFDYIPLEVYNNLNNAYDIRSTYVHGSSIPDNERDKAKKLALKLFDYTRMSLLIFIQMSKIIDKEALISKIDNALLDQSAFTKLKEMVKANCAIPIINETVKFEPS